LIAPASGASAADRVVLATIAADDAANASPGAATISFALPGAAHQIRGISRSKIALAT
jgi:hypothetical protein